MRNLWKFIETIVKKGFYRDESGKGILKKIKPTISYPVKENRVGEILGNRCLIIYTSQKGKLATNQGDNNISKLEEITKKFIDKTDLKSIYK